MSFLLASASQRRRDLLSYLDFPFDVFSPDITEEMNRPVPPEQLAADIAMDKLEFALKKKPEYDFILAADTFLSFGSCILGKAENEMEARRMLSSLSGKKHNVITGLALYTRESDNTEQTTVSTEVTFKKLGEEDLDWYIKSGEWKGVAGAYRIQEKGACLIKEIKGSWTNVVGLPLEELYGILRLHKIV